MINIRIRQLAVTASTNDDAKQAAEVGEAEGLVIHALRQTAGRGRHGRQWESPEGNLYCSVLLRPSGEIRTYGQYSFVAALALADTVTELLPHTKVTLKWPNDVLAGGKKISGILLESGTGWLVAGMGLNVLHHPDNTLYPSTSLKAANAAVLDSSKILKTLLAHFVRWHAVMQKEGFIPIRSAWLEKAQKGPLTLRLPDATIEGVFTDIDEHGHLILRLADGAKRVIATGDVFFAPGE